MPPVADPPAEGRDVGGRAHAVPGEGRDGERDDPPIEGLYPDEPRAEPRQPRAELALYHLNSFATQLLAWPLRGPEKSPLALANLIKLLRRKNVAPLETCRVRRTPRAMTTTAHPLPRATVSLLTPLADTGLRVSAGLLTRRIRGLMVRVWVT